MVRPLTVHDVPAGEPVVVHVFAPGLDVTVYESIMAPPLLAGAVHDTLACASAAVAMTLVGAPGTETGGVHSAMKFAAAVPPDPSVL